MRIKRLTETAILPTKAHPGDLGYDLYSDESLTMISGAGVPFQIHTGIAIELPKGFGAFIKDRSSMAKNGFQVCGGVIDSGYRGEIIVLARCFYGTFFIGKGQKIAQLVLVPVINVDIEETTETFLTTVRGDKGFGSSGS